jgi:hypothetical protein
MTPIALRTRLLRNWYLALIPVLGFVLLEVAVASVNLYDHTNQDFFKLWLGGHLVSLGENPYSPAVWVEAHHQFGATWIPEKSYTYPLPLAFLFVPLGVLPYYEAFIIWAFLSQVMILAALLILVQVSSDPLFRRFALPLFAGVVLFRPAIITVINGQLSGLLLLVVAGLVSQWERGKWWQGTILLSVLLLKPNLGVPMISLLAIYLIGQRQLRSLIVLGATVLFLMLAGLAYDPSWIAGFWATGGAKLTQALRHAPTIWGISSFFCRQRLDCSLAGGGAALFLLVGYFCWLFFRKRELPSAGLAVGISITLTLLLTPYVWPYDQLLLVVPIILLMSEAAKAGHRFLPVSLIFLGIDILTFILLGVSANLQTEIWNAAIPALVLLPLAGILTGRQLRPPNIGQDARRPVA